MKNLLKIFLVILGLCLTIPTARAEISYNVVVLPADLFKVCANYYCYPEVSEIIADDVISYFNKTGRINSPSLYYVRGALEKNPVVKNYTNSVLTLYKDGKKLDFTALRAIAQLFNAKSVLIISNDVPIEGAFAKRNYWEMLVLSTDFSISYQYEMETRAVLVDTVNDIVMWSCKYNKKISDVNNNFKAPNASDAYAKLEYLKMYSKDILAKSIAQNIYLRFFPKLIDPQPMVNDTKPEGAYFRYESSPSSVRPKLLEDTRPKKTDDFGELIDDNYGEMLFGI